MARPVSRFQRGDVVVVPFPFSDLTQAKRRPALVIAASGPEDFILCQITSKSVRDGLAIALDQSDFESGTLQQPSNIRPNRLFTADARLILYVAGHLRESSLAPVTQTLVRLVRGET